MKKGISWLLILLLLVSLVACGNKETAPNAEQPEKDAPAQDVITITGYMIGTDPRKEEAVKILNEEAMERLGFNVEMEIIEGHPNDYETKIRTLASTNSLPDVFWEQGGATFAQPLLDAGAPLAIEDYLDKYGFYDMVLPAAKVPSADGHIYAVPCVELFYECILYNKAIFAEKGYEVPKTVDELIVLAAQMKADGYDTPVAVAGKEGWCVDRVFEGFAYTVDPNATLDIINGKTKFTDEPYMLGIEATLKLFENGVFGEYPATIDYNGADALFGDGQAPMFFGDTSHVPSMIGNYGMNGDDIGVAYFPVVDEKYIDNYGVAAAGGCKQDAGMMVNAKTKYPEEAARVAIEFSKIFNQLRYEVGGDVATIFKYDELGWVTEAGFAQSQKDFIQDIGSKPMKALEIQDAFPGAKGGAIIMDTSSVLLTGQMTAQEFAEALNAACDTIGK